MIEAERRELIILEELESLLLQLVIVIIPVFLYQEFWLKKDHSLDVKKFKSNILGGLCIITGVLCISLQLEIYEGHLFDLRDIPLIVSFLYGGMFSGGTTLIILLLFRFGLGGDGAYIAITAFALITFFVLLYIHKFQHLTRKGKTLYFCTLIFVVSGIKTALTAFVIPEHDWMSLFSLAIAFPLVSTLTMWSMIQLLENLHEKLLMEQEIQTAERLNVIGHMAASVAHEIRNPLTVIRGFLQLFHKEPFVPEMKKEHLKLMIHELDRAETMINDYLSLAKPQAGKQEIIDVKENIEFVHDIISSYATLNNVELRVNAESGLLIRADSEKIRQVILNLVKNAIEASVDGGIVEIQAGQASSDSIYIKVIDQGIGLSEEQLHRIGSPFYTTKEKGTGLGLMVCFRIIEAMGGRIDVQSKLGKGTLFTIVLFSAKAKDVL